MKDGEFLCPRGGGRNANVLYRPFSEGAQWQLMLVMAFQSAGFASEADAAG